MDWWDNLSARWNAYTGLIKTLWQHNFYIRSVLVVLALPLGGAGALVAFWWLVGLLVGLLVQYGTEIALAVGTPIALVYWLSTRKKKPKVIIPPPQMNDALILELAKQGLTALAEITFAVFRDVAEYSPIIRPGALSELYCPNKSTCIRVKDGVAVISVMVHYSGEVNTIQFLEMFNLRLSQRLDARDLPNTPEAVFTDAANNPHTSIQAISCADCGGYLKLDVLRVNEAAVALIEAIELAKTGQSNISAPPASPFF